MFFAPERIPAVREMIVPPPPSSARRRWQSWLPMQRGDFEGIFRAMKGKPVTIRLLDPPLHEFLPKEDDDIRALAKDMGKTFDNLKATVQQLHEFNPMMGHRGCRLPSVYPEIGEMQTQAVIEGRHQRLPRPEAHHPEIMVPLGGLRRKDLLREEAHHHRRRLIAKSGLPA
jgi:pyruvate,orthophosphate dikinase